MTRNLRLNSDTEVLILGPKHLRDTLSNDIASLDEIALASIETVFDLNLSFDSHKFLGLFSFTYVVTSEK